MDASDAQQYGLQLSTQLSSTFAVKDNDGLSNVHRFPLQ